METPADDWIGKGEYRRQHATGQGDEENMDIERIDPRVWNCRACVYGDLVFLSGAVAEDKALPMKEQTEQVLGKIDKDLAAAGTDKSHILSATVYLADIDRKEEMNEAWMAWMDPDNMPCRTAVGAALTPGTLVEITVCAARP
ncbi:MAG TPA: RidA family protein [Alphaproteobacteria bacterium]|nr:RidA family protein [Alphaproteobacteria bacterium]